MTNRIQKISSIGGLILLNAVLAGCGGTSADSNGEGGGTVASAPVAERSGSAERMHQGMDPEAAPNPGPQQILIDNFTFSPASSRSRWAPGDVGQPRRRAAHRHQLAKPRLFDSGTMDTDDQFVYVFTSAGHLRVFLCRPPAHDRPNHRQVNRHSTKENNHGQSDHREPRQRRRRSSRLPRVHGLGGHRPGLDRQRRRPGLPAGWAARDRRGRRGRISLSSRSATATSALARSRTRM